LPDVGFSFLFFSCTATTRVKRLPIIIVQTQGLEFKENEKCFINYPAGAYTITLKPAARPTMMDTMLEFMIYFIFWWVTNWERVHPKLTK
jgi:hypothetical protein